MKYIFSYILLGVFFWNCTTTRNWTPPLQKSPYGQYQFIKNPVVAHRGAFKKMGHPENSIASLKQAIALKCTGSEFDVRMTMDDSLVINHDPHYFWMSIEKTLYKDLIKKTLSNGEKLPTLREYIQTGQTNNTQTRLVLEIKPSETSKAHGQVIAAKVVHLVKDMKAQNLIEYLSFDYDILKKIVEINPNAITHYLNGDKSPEELKADKIKGADYHFSVFKNKPQWIESAKKNGIILDAWTVNDAKDMDWLLAQGFNFITTNEPELLFERIKNSPISKSWQLAWSDEFNYKGLPDSSIWGYDVGGHGWGNQELQYYTQKRLENARVDNGFLTIEARKEDFENNKYTSTRLVTRDKKPILYGRIEVNAKLPKGRGSWPAIWALGQNIKTADWPLCGEIDIMEHVGFDPNRVHGTVHTKAYNHGISTHKSGKIMVDDVFDTFHTYAVDWTPEKIDFFIDENLFFTFKKESDIDATKWSFNQPQYLLLNIAVGGGWGGQKGVDDSIFPLAMVVDYVRVYKK